MEETQRFLRYVMPGALFFIEALFYLLILWPDKTSELLYQVLKPNWVGALAVFLGLGVMGFLFSIFHHLSREWKYSGSFDHRLVIKKLRERHVLLLSDPNDGKLWRVENEPDRHQAWAIFNALWHQRASKDHSIEGANP
jgi:hypothetical protein